MPNKDEAEGRTLGSIRDGPQELAVELRRTYEALRAELERTAAESRRLCAQARPDRAVRQAQRAASGKHRPGHAAG
jgi:hypothetical protein